MAALSENNLKESLLFNTQMVLHVFNVMKEVITVTTTERGLTPLNGRGVEKSLPFTNCRNTSPFVDPQWIPISIKPLVQIIAMAEILGYSLCAVYEIGAIATKAITKLSRDTTIPFKK